MDDPWGSPWATSDNPTASSTSPSKTILEPPPAAFLSTPSNLTLPSAQSPWGLDDDAFGDWASPDPAKASNASPWAWGNEPAPIEQLTPSYEPRPRRKSSTPKWPSSRSASPGLRAPTTPNSLSSGRFSPDPWANASSFTKDDPEPLAQLPQIPDVPSTTLDTPTIELEPDTPRQIIPESNSINGRPIFDFQRDIFESISKPPDDIADIPVNDYQPARFHGPSPSSASASSGEEDGVEDDDDDDDEPQNVPHADSPITSIEDNPIVKSIQRKASSKVQSLVEMYDGIAKRTTVTPERQPPPRRSASRDLNASTDDASIHDLDDCISSNDDESRPAQVSSAEDVEKDSAKTKSDAANEWEELRKPKVPEHDPFVIDLSNLDALVPEPTSLPTPEDAGDVTDRIITDSFTGISERKMWYRLSRHESLRKFNVGHDENYVRITWMNSTMRDETMKIVRRWMEEDSMGGRAFRGGLARKAGGKFFGWDSTTESTPVDLDRVFGRKAKRQASVHRPTHSIHALPSLSTAPMVPASKEGTPASAQAKDNWGGLASFGWSTAPGDSKTAEEAKAPERTNFAKPLPLGFRGFDNTPKSHASLPVFASTKPFVPTTSTADKPPEKEAEDEDEDDEWGDMVSPTTAEATDSTSLPKTSWDSFSTNPLPDALLTAPSDSPLASNPRPESLGTGNKTAEESKSGVKDIGNVIRPAPASTPAAPSGTPHSQVGSIKPPESTYAFRPASVKKRPPNISIAPNSIDPPAPSHDGKAGVSAGGLLNTPLTSGLGTPSTAQPRNSTDDSELVQQILRNLPDLSYMLK